MATTSDYLNQLLTDKATLVDNLVEMGVEASNEETFTELVPKVLDISTGSDIEITNASYLFCNNARLNIMDELLDMCKNTTNTSYMFQNSSNLLNFDFSKFKTAKIANAARMFDGCYNLTSIDFNAFDGSYLTNIDRMFNGCVNLTSIDFSKFISNNITGGMSGICYNCQNISSIDLSNINTSRVNNMTEAFSGCTNLTNINLKNFDASKCIYFSYTFQNCTNLHEVDISDIASTHNYPTTTRMFYNSGISKLIINSTKLFPMSNIDMLQNTPIASGTGYVYVPDNMVETYKSATNWSTYADQIKPISELEEV